MKLVREHINEMFTEDSDPISDMGIGLSKKLNEIEKNLNKYFVKVDVDKNNFTIKISAVNRYDSDVDFWIDRNVTADFYLRYFIFYDLKTDAYSDSCIATNQDIRGWTWKSKPFRVQIAKQNPKEIAREIIYNFEAMDEYVYDALRDAERYALKNMKLVKEDINEKFTEDSDPIYDMGIGVTPHLIEKLIYKIFELDIKNHFIPSYKGDGNIQGIGILFDQKMKSNSLYIDFYSNRYYDPDGKEVDKKKYAIKLLKLSGLSDFLNMQNTIMRPPKSQFPKGGSYSPWMLSVQTKDNFIKVFNELDGSRFDLKDYLA